MLVIDKCKGNKICNMFSTLSYSWRTPS